MIQGGPEERKYRISRGRSIEQMNRHVALGADLELSPEHNCHCTSVDGSRREGLGANGVETSLASRRSTYETSTTREVKTPLHMRSSYVIFIPSKLFRIPVKNQDRSSKGCFLHPMLWEIHRPSTHQEYKLATCLPRDQCVYLFTASI